MARLPPDPGEVTLGWFELDHVGTEIGEHAAGERSRNDARQVENAQTLKRILGQIT